MPETVTERAVFARQLLPGEHLPERYFGDPLFGAIFFKPDWCWVIEQHNEIIGYLFAPPCEGEKAVTMMRLKMDDNAPEHSVLVLLRQFFRDCRARGVTATFSHFDPMEETENRLAALMVKCFGGKLFWNVCAPIPKES